MAKSRRMRSKTHKRRSYGKRKSNRKSVKKSMIKSKGLKKYFKKLFRGGEFDQNCYRDEMMSKAQENQGSVSLEEEDYIKNVRCKINK